MASTLGPAPDGWLCSSGSAALLRPAADDGAAHAAGLSGPFGPVFPIYIIRA